MNNKLELSILIRRIPPSFHFEGGYTLAALPVNGKPRFVIGSRTELFDIFNVGMKRIDHCLSGL